MKWVFAACLFLAGIVAVPPSYLCVVSLQLSLWNLVVAFLALSCLVVSTPLFLGTVVSWRDRQSKGARSGRVLLRLSAFALWFLSLVTVITLSAPASPGAANPLKEHYLGSQSDESPCFAGIPERELAILGAALGLSLEEIEETRGLSRFDQLYKEARATLGEVPSRVLDSWLFDRGHYWVVCPLSSKPPPLLVFLHGSGGNFQAYPTLLMKSALKNQVAVVMPTYGWGQWSQPGAQVRIGEVIEETLRRYPALDRGRVIVAGVSAGAAGALEYWCRNSESLAGVIAVSGVPTLPSVEHELTGKQALLIHGSLDGRMPAKSLREFDVWLRKKGAQVECVEFPESGHFTLLTHSEEVSERMFEWIGTL